MATVSPFKQSFIRETCIQTGELDSRLLDKCHQCILRTKLLEAKLAEKEAAFEHGLVLADICTRLTHLESKMKTTAQWVTTTTKQRSDEIKKFVKSQIDSLS